MGSGYKAMQAFCIIFAILVLLYLIGLGSLAQVRQHKREYLVQLLREVSVVMEGNDIPYVIYWGTLLGSVREGQIIENDDDVDFVVLGKEHHARALQALATAYGPKRVKGTKFHFTGIFKPLHADIQYATQDADGAWVRQDVMAHIGKMRADTPVSRKPVSLHGVQVYEPPEARSILKELYGDDYMIPQAYKKTDGDPRHNALELRVRSLFKDLGLYI